MNLLSKRNTITLGSQIRRAKALRLIMRNNIYIYVYHNIYKSKLSKGNKKETNQNKLSCNGKHIKDKKVINWIIRMAAMVTAGKSATIKKYISKLMN